MLHKPENMCGFYIWNNFKDARNTRVGWSLGLHWWLRGLREWHEWKHRCWRDIELLLQHRHVL
jgi:hypothetical protein